MNKNLKQTIKIISLLIVIIILIIFIKNHLTEFGRIFDLKLWQFFVLLFIALIGLCINSYFFKSILELFNINIKFKESFILTVINNYSNYLFFKGGLIARSHYLKKQYNFPYKNYSLIFVLINLITFFAIAMVGIAVSVYKILNNYNFNIYLLLIFILILLISIILFLLPKRVLNFFAIKKNSLLQLSALWIQIRKNKKIIKPLIITFIAILWASFKIFIIYKMLFNAISFSSAIIINIMGVISVLFAVTPAALGIKEWLMSYSAQLINENFISTGIVVSLDRIISIILIISLGIIFSFYLIKEKF